MYVFTVMDFIFFAGKPLSKDLICSYSPLTNLTVDSFLIYILFWSFCHYFKSSLFCQGLE